MPPSGRRRTRKEPDLQPSDAETADVVNNTPTRKRRRVNTAEHATAATADNRRFSSHRRRESVETDATIENPVGDIDAEEQAQYVLADEVIRQLRTSNHAVNAMIDYNNDIVDKSAQAFAKIAGRTWTFYVSTLRVVIGRPYSKHKRISAGSSVQSQETGTPARTPAFEDLKVDIDLGPDQQISRLHAQIEFDGEHEKWYIFVNGRNHLHVDMRKVEMGERAWLHSGAVISILGTQMMFMLPGMAPVIHPDIKRQAFAEDEETEPETKEEKSFKPVSGRGGRGRTSNAYQAATSRPGSQATSRSYPQAGQTASSSQVQPGTPSGKAKEQSQPRSKPSPAYSRGVMMESTEEIDYSVEGAKDIKPPHSYASMIGQAILSTPEENATLAKIYEYIKEHYAFFRYNGGGWQNSIRHNLSLSKSFEKIPRRTDEPGKGMKWQIVPELREEFLKKNIQPTRRIRHFPSSGPNSPANNIGAVAQTERLMGVIGQRETPSKSRKMSRSMTPPLASYPAATESYTPDRGPRAPFLQTNNLSNTNEGNTLESANSANSEGTPTYRHSRAPQELNAGPAATSTTGLKAGAFNSPPTLTSSTYDMNNMPGMFTPLVPRHKPLAAVQSTCKAPSFYAKELFSSPAPFWKYLDIGSTPARLPELSPYKNDVDKGKTAAEDEDEDDNEENDEEGTDAEDRAARRSKDVLQPSSPPLLDAGGGSSGNEADTSPTRTLSRPVSRSMSSKKSASGDLSNTTPSKQPTMQADSTTPVGFPNLPNMLGIKSAGPLVPKLNPYVRVEADDDDDGEIDLSRGFEKIGSFHRTIHAANAVTR